MGSHNQITIEYWRALKEMRNPRAGKLCRWVSGRWYTTYHLIN